MEKATYLFCLICPDTPLLESPDPHHGAIQLQTLLFRQISIDSCIGKVSRFRLGFSGSFFTQIDGSFQTKGSRFLRESQKSRN